MAACVTDLGEESEAISGYYNRPWSKFNVCVQMWWDRATLSDVSWFRQSGIK